MKDWRDLQTRFLAIVEAASCAENVQRETLWRMLAEHPWYLRELQLAAGRVVSQKRLGRDLVEDVTQTALVLLEQELRSLPDLGWDPARGDDAFPRWLRTIIARQCRLAVRRLRRSWDSESEALCEADLACSSTELLERRLDLYGALHLLDERARTVVLRYARGWSFRDIATDLHEPYHAVYSIWRRAIKRLRVQLGNSTG